MITLPLAVGNNACLQHVYKGRLPYIPIKPSLAVNTINAVSDTFGSLQRKQGAIPI
jgi:hypothetical protein